jgi:SAM-dependent methyltransferase
MPIRWQASLSSALLRLSKRHSRRNLYRWLREAIDAERIPARPHVLNIGAGGEIEDEITRAGVRVRSIDVDPRRNPDIVASLEHLTPIADGSTDAVFAMEVLEHVRNPVLAVSELYRILRPGGVLVGSTPFLLGIHDHPYDFFRFTFHGLRSLFRHFEQVTLRERNGYFAAIAVLILRNYAIGREAHHRRSLLLSPLLVPLALALALFDRVLPSLDGTTGYFFVFRKPHADEAAQP